MTWSSEVTSSIYHLVHDPKSIDWFSNEDQSRLFFFLYFFLLDLHPCIGIECEKFTHCVAISPCEYTCQCNTSSPSYEEKVCASNGRTFSNLCLLNKEMCDTNANFTIYHTGSCTGIPNSCHFIFLMRTLHQKKTFLHIVDGSIGTASLDYQPLLRNMSPRSFASPLPRTPPSREEWRHEKASQIEPRGRRGEQGFSNDEKF